MQDVKEVLAEARTIIEQGWNQYGNTDGRGNFCLKAAVGLAAGAYVLVNDGKEVAFDRIQLNEGPERSAAQLKALKMDLRAIQAVAAHLPEGYESVPVFNDDPRTTKNDVLAVLDKAISSC